MYNTIEIEKELINDFTSFGVKEINGERYEPVDKYIENDEGEAVNFYVYKRISDGKYFEYSWSCYNGNYYYEPIWYEVEMKKTKLLSIRWDYIDVE